MDPTTVRFITVPYVLEPIAHGQQLKWTLNTGLHASDAGIGYGQPVLLVATAQVTM